MDNKDVLCCNCLVDSSLLAVNLKILEVIIKDA